MKFGSSNTLLFSGQVVTFRDPPTAGHSDSVLSNLQTPENVRISSYKVLYRIPNIKELCYGLSIRQKFHIALRTWFAAVISLRVETLHLDRRSGLSSNELSAVKWFPSCLKE